MTARRQKSLVALAAAALALAFPAGAAAQQPIQDEYGLPPLDHHSHAGGGGGGGGGAGSGSNAFASSGAAAGSPLRAGDVRRGEKNAGGSGATAGHGHGSDQRVGIGKPVPPPSTAAADPRGGFDVLLLVVGGLAAVGLLTFAVLQVRRPGRTV
ncbi:MAG TPA: hypothetical protein VHR88_01905 [Solirubrobacteraceae bacterium]|nr:hypothetical protein [Solirubrobacteraceae bacterium]